MDVFITFHVVFVCEAAVTWMVVNDLVLFEIVVLPVIVAFAYVIVEGVVFDHLYDIGFFVSEFLDIGLVCMLDYFAVAKVEVIVVVFDFVVSSCVFPIEGIENGCD